MNIAIFANSIHTNTLSGGDKIFVECAKRWIGMGHNVTIITNGAGERYCVANGVSCQNIVFWRSSFFDRLGFVLSNFFKIFSSLFYSILRPPPTADIVFASSFFLPDVLPALLLKMRKPTATMVTASYIFTKEPFGRDYSGGKLKGFIFWINQTISLSIVGNFGSKALTASAEDRHRFAQLRRMNEADVLAVRGGVDNAFFASVPAQPLIYDAVFMGRFHPQKCVPELIDIWEKIAAWDNKRVLALVGAGIEEKKLRDLVLARKLQHNVVFLGMQDGVEKVKILKSSRVFVSASRFDTGNIALDEGMACGLPGIVYDLPHLDYPSGVIKIAVGNHEEFVRAIQKVLSDDAQRARLSSDALVFANTIDWDKKAKELLDFLTG